MHIRNDVNNRTDLGLIAVVTAIANCSRLKPTDIP